MRGLNITTDHKFQLQRKQMIQKYQPASGLEGLHVISRIQAPHSHLRYAHKTHYRIVFKEKGITIEFFFFFKVIKFITRCPNAVRRRNYKQRLAIL